MNEHRKLFKPKHPEMPTQCASCPFKNDNTKELGKFISKLIGMKATIGQINNARARVRLDVMRNGGEFRCHASVYTHDCKSQRPESENRQCPGATKFYKES